MKKRRKRKKEEKESKRERENNHEDDDDESREPNKANIGSPVARLENNRSAIRGKRTMACCRRRWLRKKEQCKGDLRGCTASLEIIARGGGFGRETLLLITRA